MTTTEEPTYETANEILSFVMTGNICFCEGYSYNIEIDGITYPSVRHAVLSSKTKDPEIKKLIARTKLPADLKDLERSTVATEQLWSTNFILSLLDKYTFQKFQEKPAFAEKLLATGQKRLRNILDEGRHLIIDEIAHLEDQEEKRLVAVRNFLVSEKS